MKAITLRNIPTKVRRAIRSRADQRNISADKAVIELLEERVGTIRNRKATLHHDLDELVGSWNQREAETFDQTIEAGRQIDESLWR